MLNVWWAGGFEPRCAEGFVEAMRSALGKPLRFGDADHIGWPCELRAGKRLFG